MLGDFMWQKVKIYGVSIAIPLAVGGLAAFLTRNSMDIYEKINQPFLAPPSWVFPVVWTVLYVLMGVSAAMIYDDEKASVDDKKHALRLYGINLAVNFLWSIIFFNLGAFLAAFLWLMLLIFVIMRMTAAFYKIKPIAAYLQVPYVVWCCFATYLTASIWLMNS
jgi:tryptophan-rich sensory protein